MKKKYFYIAITFLLILTIACQNKESADLVIKNASIFTANDDTSKQFTAIAVKDGKIIELGNDDDILAYKGEKTNVIDANGAFVMPGFIEGHGHFHALGESNVNVNLMNTKSWQEIVDKVKERIKISKPNDWVIGRGWHQEKWISSAGATVDGFPYHDLLSAISTDNPLILEHASGHALIANAKAMQLANINTETNCPKGGVILKDFKGKFTGVFQEEAMSLIQNAYQKWIDSLPKDAVKARWVNAVMEAQKECLSKGITSFQDAGSSIDETILYKELAENGKLDIRLWAMILEPYDSLKFKLKGYPWIGLGNNHLTVRAIKGYLDGALGSYGAWLLKPYSDNPSTSGQNTTPILNLEKTANLCLQYDLQFCVHAIGDRANREILNLYHNVIAKSDNPELYLNGRRWRVEHAQHIDTIDIPRFADMGVIASMQGIHCTSDAPFVDKRLGKERAKISAYPWRSLLDKGAHFANGTDAPVEDVNPLACLYALVTRKRADNGYEFYPEQCLTRLEALKAYTVWNAYAAFEENEKGTLHKGRLADITIVDKNLLTCPNEEILKAKILYTIVGGKILFKSN